MHGMKYAYSIDTHQYSSVNTAYMFHFMHSLYSSIICILKTNFSYVLCRWLIHQMTSLLAGDQVPFVFQGGVSPLLLAPGDHEVAGGGDVTILPPGEADSICQAGL